MTPPGMQSPGQDVNLKVCVCVCVCVAGVCLSWKENYY